MNKNDKSVPGMWRKARIVRKWLPTSGYEYANVPDVEIYLNSDPFNSLYEAWIPVVRKDNVEN